MKIKINYRIDNKKRKIDPEGVFEHEFDYRGFFGEMFFGDKAEYPIRESSGYVFEYWAQEIADMECRQSVNTYEEFENGEEIVVSILSEDRTEVLAECLVTMRMEPVFIAQKINPNLNPDPQKLTMAKPEPEELTEEQIRELAEKIARFYLDRDQNLHLPLSWFFGMNTKKTQWSNGYYESLRVSVEREHEYKTRCNEEEAAKARIVFLEEEVKRMKILIGEVAIQNLPNRGKV